MKVKVPKWMKAVSDKSEEFIFHCRKPFFIARPVKVKEKIELEIVKMIEETTIDLQPILDDGASWYFYKFINSRSKLNEK